MKIWQAMWQKQRKSMAWHSSLLPLAFTLLFAALFPLCFGDKVNISALATPVFALALCFGVFLQSPDFFAEDYQDGTLSAMWLALRFWHYLLCKLAVIFVFLILPFLLLSPLLSIWYQLDFAAFIRLFSALLLASPALLVLALFASALTLASSRSALLLIFIVLPFYLPALLLIVASQQGSHSSAFYQLQLALDCFFMTLFLPATAAALKSALSAQ